MYAVIFEVNVKPSAKEEYLSIASELRKELVQFEGFLSIERFQSLANAEKLVSISFWESEDAIRNWRNHIGHANAQIKGKHDLFEDYRIRVAQVVRDYGAVDRSEAPT